MHAVVLAGGRGVRLRPYTTCIPKPLVPIGDRYSILEIILRQLSAQGFRTVTLALGHLGHLIRAYVGDGTQWGLEQVEYVTETVPLGTIGPLVQMRDRLLTDFLVMNGDILTDLDYGDLLRRHTLWGANLTVATYPRQVRIDFGVLTSRDGHIVGFSEKPVIDYRVSMGVYAMNAAALDRYQPGVPLGFDQLVLDLIARGEEPAEYRFSGRWLDIGRPDDYDRANAEFARYGPQLLGEEAC
ncbi:sugar phosphate nucleotidyltransferase [Actinoplanes sp. NPDC049802]|uniref:sugar phosphate nucleotidyltransferase n=1 Tax=Actinoplanes sp. NPDC049802 TaxID=3154742 RepID=UPI0033CDB20A